MTLSSFSKCENPPIKRRRQNGAPTRSIGLEKSPKISGWQISRGKTARKVGVVEALGSLVESVKDNVERLGDRRVVSSQTTSRLVRKTRKGLGYWSERLDSSLDR
jgi:hypothetical protein